jgi:hypothetical protein
LDVDGDSLDTAYQLYYPDQLTGYALVVGPVGVNRGGVRVPDYSLPSQYKFEGAAVGSLVFDSYITLR